MRSRTTVNLLGTVAIVIASLLLTGCPPTNPSSPSLPDNHQVAASYIHKPSGMAFPQSVNDFQRVNITRYDKEGLDVPVGYDLFDPLRAIAATVYVYPAPRVVSIASPPDVVAKAKDIAAKGEFERRKQEILQAHSGAKLIQEKDISLVQTGATRLGRMARFESEDVFANKRQAVEGQVYLFCYVNGDWVIKYRFSYPKSFDAAKDIDDFMRDLSWAIGDSQ